MSRRIKTWILVAAFPVITAAQQNETLRDRDPDLTGAKKVAAEIQQANFRSGPFYLLSRFRLAEVSLGGPVYVPAGDDDSGLSIGIEAPQRLYFVPHRKTVFSVEATPSYSFFGGGPDREDVSEEERPSGQFNYRLQADAHLLLNHIYLNLYTRRADELRSHVSDLNRLATVRERETGVAGELKYSSRTSAVFSTRLRETVYPRERYQPVGAPNGGGATLLPVERLDRDETNGRISLVHKTFPRTALFVAAEGSEYDFHTLSESDASRRWAGAGAHFDSGRTQIRLEAGPATLEFDDPASNDFTGMLGGASVSHLRRRWKYDLSFNRDVGFALYSGNRYFKTDFRAAAAEYQATRRLILRLASAWQTDSYDTPVGGIEREDDVMFTTAGFRYSTLKLTTGLDLGWYERSSSIGLEEDSGIRYVVHLSFTP